MKKLFIAICLLFISMGVTAQNEIEAISKTLTDYIEGSTNGQPERLKKAFYEGLNLYYTKNDSLRIWSGEEYIKSTKQGEPTGEFGKIISIDYENNAAVAKVEIKDPNNTSSYIDYFMLLKVNGHWTIMHKMFTKRTPPSKR